MRRLFFNLFVALLLPATSHGAPDQAAAAVSACFTPGPGSCAEQIDAAKASVKVQAYYLTQPLILRAIAGAKRRGLEVEAILDKSQDRRGSARSHYSGATYLANAGVPVWIDDAPAIAHSKIIILDDRLVVTGSCNFTKAADTRNAENVVMIDSKTVAAWFTRNWEERRSASRRFEVEQRSDPGAGSIRLFPASNHPVRCKSAAKTDVVQRPACTASTLPPAPPTGARHPPSRTLVITDVNNTQDRVLLRIA